MSVIAEEGAGTTDERALFELRREVDASRQPTYQATLNALVKATQGSQTPYRLSYPEKIRAIEACATKAQPRWEAQKSVEPYLYRIGSWQSLLKGSGWRDRYESDNHELSFTTHLERAKTRRWTPLSAHANGPLSGFGGVTWWTPASTINTGTVFEAAHENGMPDDWLASQSVVLRCDTNQIRNNGFVPSTLDAFFSEVFLATRESEKPSHGYAIRLNTAGPLDRGAIELICGDLLASAIEFSPIEISLTAEILILDDQLRGRLATFLRKALS